MMNPAKCTVLLMAAFLLFSCQSDQDKQQNKLEKSKKNWETLKSENTESYRYVITSASWTGYSTSTTITVENGVVMKREFESYNQDNEGGKVLVESYVETGEELGIHEDGAGLYTIDELYDTCKKEYLTVDPDKNSIYFTTFDNGLVNSCGYVPENCADDCFFGFRLDVIEWLD